MDEVLESFNPWWTGDYRTDTIPRDRYLEMMLPTIEDKDIALVFGMRRVGKTVIMQQIIERLLKLTSSENVLYVSLEHPAFQDMTILDIIREHRRMHSLPRDRKLYVFLDEVHLKAGFERDLKVLYDMERIKVFATGSSSVMLRERGSLLTGRCRFFNVLPLDFSEYLQFKGIKVKGSESYLYEKALEDHMQQGGIPENVLRGGPQHYLLDMVDGIITKDIISRYALKRPDQIMRLLLLLSERCGKLMTFSKLARVLDITVDTVKAYIQYLEETYLVKTILRYSPSLNERIYSPRKVYFNDTGIRTMLTGFKDIGSFAENLVYLRLAKEGDVTYYHEGSSEIDFILEGSAFEVKYKKNVPEDELRALKVSDFKRKVLISLKDQRYDDISDMSLLDMLLGRIDPIERMTR